MRPSSSSHCCRSRKKRRARKGGTNGHGIDIRVMEPSWKMEREFFCETRSKKRLASERAAEKGGDRDRARTQRRQVGREGQYRGCTNIVRAADLYHTAIKLLYYVPKDSCRALGEHNLHMPLAEADAMRISVCNLSPRNACLYKLQASRSEMISWK